MRILIVSFVILGLAACSGSDDSTEVIDTVPVVTAAPGEKGASSRFSVKTGAAVVFASEFAGSLLVGEMAPLVIYLRPEYTSGQLQVDIKGQNGLTVVGETRFSESFSDDYQFTQQLIVGAEQAGEYYLGVVATVITDSGERHARAFSETVRVVNPAAELSGKVIEEVEGAEAYLPAAEEIIVR